MRLDLDETIAALASSPGPAARGIIRISGPQAVTVFEDWFEPSATGEPQPRSVWPPHRPSRVSGNVPLESPFPDQDRLKIPVDLHVWPTRRSYVGQPTVEVHLFGAPALLEMVLAEVYRRGARPAQPGEFTLRAFLSGKLDLVQAEAVLGVIDAGNSHELELALSQLAGGLSGRLHVLRSQLLETFADLEAGLDFVDEDIEFVSREEIRRQLNSASQLLAELATDAELRLQISDAPRIVLAGLPNAGKSTLFNALVGERAALVSATAGTTRDYLEGRVVTPGMSFDLIDTAGWELTSEQICEVAQKLRRDQIDRADLVLLCVPAVGEDSALSTSAEETLVRELAESGRPMLRVLTKGDLRESPEWESSAGEVAVSAVSGAGLNVLLHAIQDRFSRQEHRQRQFIGMTAARCRECLRSALDSLRRAIDLIDTAAGDELLSIEIREVLDHIGEIVGAVYTDDLLDRVFSKFCIGK